MPLTKADIERPPYNRATIIGYNRLEGVPVTTDYRKSLSAPVHDALWMLTRQWQMGEFDAEDAGTPVRTAVLSEQQMMTHVDTGVLTMPLDQPSSAPLEMIVEKEKRTPDIALRIELGKSFTQLLTENSLHAQLPAFLKQFKLQLLEQANEETEEAQLVARAKVNRMDAQLFDAIKNRMLDGFAIFQSIAGNAYDAWANTNLSTAGSNIVTAVVKTAQDFLSHISLFYSDLTQNSSGAWKPEQLGYQFNVQSDSDATKSTLLSVADYPGRRLDWYNFDIKQTNSGNTQKAVQTFIPAPVTYPGMPKSRWWEMEENEINLGDVNVKTTDIPTLLLIDFALIYGNDWLIVPFPMKLNQLCSIGGLLLKDVFGFYTYIPPVDARTDITWQNWSLFSHNSDAASAVRPYFYLAPAVLKPIHQEPLERVSFVRDEMSNMAWAFENVIPGSFGGGLRTPEVMEAETASENGNQNEGPVKYLLGKEVPFYQVPFVPVAIPFDATHSQMRLQRAKMPTGGAARGVVLTETPSPYYIREENIPGTGTMITRRWQRARWINGGVAQWVGREKQTGKSEGSSAFEFDVLI